MQTKKYQQQKLKINTSQQQNQNRVSKFTR